MRPTNNKTVNAFLQRLLRDGWHYTSSGKHIKLFGPMGGFIVISKTPSDRRVLDNIRQLVKRASTCEHRYV